MTNKTTTAMDALMPDEIYLKKGEKQYGFKLHSYPGATRYVRAALATDKRDGDALLKFDDQWRNGIAWACEAFDRQTMIDRLVSLCERMITERNALANNQPAPAVPQPVDVEALKRDAIHSVLPKHYTSPDHKKPDETIVEVTIDYLQARSLLRTTPDPALTAANEKIEKIQDVLRISHSDGDIKGEAFNWLWDAMDDLRSLLTNPETAAVISAAREASDGS